MYHKDSRKEIIHHETHSAGYSYQPDCMHGAKLSGQAHPLDNIHYDRCMDEDEERLLGVYLMSGNIDIRGTQCVPRMVLEWGHSWTTFQHIFDKMDTVEVLASLIRQKQ